MSLSRAVGCAILEKHIVLHIEIARLTWKLDAFSIASNAAAFLSLFFRITAGIAGAGLYNFRTLFI